MPVILDRADTEAWLDVESVPADRAAALLRPAPDSLLEFFAIAPKVNKVANDEPSIQEPFEGDAVLSVPPPPPRQGSLF
jgi:putative SOS response-associated peptidase YedK